MRRWLIPLLLVVGCSSLAFFVGSFFGPEEPPEPPATELVDKSHPPVILAVRGLARLEGAEYHMERIIDLREKQSRFNGLLQAEDAILLVAVGNVVAGVDLSGLVEANVTIDDSGKRVELRLPRAEVFSASLDSSKTYVHSRSTDILAERQESLETKARARAEASLREAALDGGILGRAERNVERTVTLLLTSLGFEHVEITFEGPRPEPSR